MKDGGNNMKEKVILAYSGGLDTTAIIPWLKENFGYELDSIRMEVPRKTVCRHCP